MWNRRKEEDIERKPAPIQPAAPEPKKEGTQMSSMPGRISEPHLDSSRGGNAVLGKSVVVKGQIISREDLTIDGEVEGTVELQEHRLTVGPNGKVTASIKARELVVLGSVQGNVETSDKIDIRKEARLVGDIKTARIVIEDGAYFKGNIDITRAETSRTATAQKSPTSAATPISSASAMAAGANDAKR